MQSERIPDSALRASSVYFTEQSKAINGRLHFLSRSGRIGAWMAKTNDAFQFLEANLSDWTNVTRVAIQGRQDFDYWVKSFSLSYGYDGVLFKAYIEDGLQKVF